jgi:four helix bundle protein
MTNDQAPMTNASGDTRPRKERRFDLAHRTAAFGEMAIRFLRSIHRDAVTMPLISQLVRSSTSIGANYVEADEAGSNKEFKYRISICRRESRETQYWLQMLVAANPEIKDQARPIWQEAREPVLIFESIHRNADARAK